MRAHLLDERVRVLSMPCASLQKRIQGFNIAREHARRLCKSFRQCRNHTDVVAGASDRWFGCRNPTSVENSRAHVDWPTLQCLWDYAHSCSVVRKYSPPFTRYPAAHTHPAAHQSLQEAHLVPGTAPYTVMYPKDLAMGEQYCAATDTGQGAGQASGQSGRSVNKRTWFCTHIVSFTNGSCVSLRAQCPGLRPL